MSLGSRAPVAKKKRDEAERPFWISFSDLMTALMVLFLVAMSVALMAITREISEAEEKKVEREAEIAELMQRLHNATREFPGVRVHGRVVDFGDRARFETNSHRLNDAQVRLLRGFTPHILALARDPLGDKWLKRVVVDGYADARGSYLHNLNLSLQRSERVLCVLQALPPQPLPLSEADRQLVRELFLVGGASFNALRESAEESRRIEMRLEFRDLDEAPVGPRPPTGDGDGRCPLDL